MQIIILLVFMYSIFNFLSFYKFINMRGATTRDFDGTNSHVSGNFSLLTLVFTFGGIVCSIILINTVYVLLVPSTDIILHPVHIHVLYKKLIYQKNLRKYNDV